MQIVIKSLICVTHSLAKSQLKHLGAYSGTLLNQVNGVRRQLVLYFIRFGPVWHVFDGLKVNNFTIRKQEIERFAWMTFYENKTKLKKNLNISISWKEWNWRKFVWWSKRILFVSHRNKDVNWCLTFNGKQFDFVYCSTAEWNRYKTTDCIKKRKKELKQEKLSAWEREKRETERKWVCEREGKKERK